MPVLSQQSPHLHLPIDGDSGNGKRRPRSGTLATNHDRDAVPNDAGLDAGEGLQIMERERIVERLGANLNESPKRSAASKKRRLFRWTVSTGHSLLIQCRRGPKKFSQPPNEVYDGATTEGDHDGRYNNQNDFHERLNTVLIRSAGETDYGWTT